MEYIFGHRNKINRMLSFVSVHDIPSRVICSVLNFYIVLLYSAKMEVLPIFFTELQMATRNAPHMHPL